VWWSTVLEEDKTETLTGPPPANLTPDAEAVPLFDSPEATGFLEGTFFDEEDFVFFAELTVALLL
jgi:hypothetical protein